MKYKHKEVVQHVQFNDDGIKIWVNDPGTFFGRLIFKLKGNRKIYKTSFQLLEEEAKRCKRDIEAISQVSLFGKGWPYSRKTATGER